MEHITVALTEKGKGIKEYKGTGNHNPEILKYASETGMYSNGTDEQAWCSIFMNWVAFKSNLERSNKGNARSWLAVGLEVTEPQIGDIVIFWRGTRSGWKGHVGIFYGFTSNKKYIKVLGGNQSDSVNIQNYPVHRLLGYRRLRKISSNQKELRSGDKGEAVRILQNQLNEAGFHCGKVDGHFGKQTEEAVLSLQHYGKLKLTGFYNTATQHLLQSLLNNEHTSYTEDAKVEDNSENSSYENESYTEYVEEKEEVASNPAMEGEAISKPDETPGQEDYFSEDFFENNTFDFDWESKF